MSTSILMTKMEEGVGFAAVLPFQTLDGGLPRVTSIFITEMYSIKTTMEELVENSVAGNYTIFSDFQSVLQALKSNTCHSPMVTGIHLLLYRAVTI